MCKRVVNHQQQHQHHPILKACVVYQHCHPSGGTAATLVIIISSTNMYNLTLAECIKVIAINART